MDAREEHLPGTYTEIEKGWTLTSTQNIREEHLPGTYTEIEKGWTLTSTQNIRVNTYRTQTLTQREDGRHPRHRTFA